MNCFKDASYTCDHIEVNYKPASEKVFLSSVGSLDLPETMKVYESGASCHMMWYQYHVASEGHD
jgi:hypothetical protein